MPGTGWALARRLAPHEPDQFAADARERVLAELAARVVGEPSEDALRFLERLVAIDQQPLPVERLRHPAIIAVVADCRTPGTCRSRD